MIPMHTVFIFILMIFGLIGSLRGWAKELLVAFSVLLALFIENVLTGMVPPIAAFWGTVPEMTRFWVRVVLFTIIVIFGYASPTLASRFAAKIARERLQDVLLGIVIGLLNGALIIGTIWFYLDEAHYGVQPEHYSFQPVYDDSGEVVWTTVVYNSGVRGIGGIIPPEQGSTAERMLPYLPPRIITGTYLFLAVGFAFVFVIIVFV